MVDGVQTGSPETDTTTRRTIHPDGSQDSRLHIIGIPTHAQMPDTTISPMPGTDPLMLQETDHKHQLRHPPLVVRHNIAGHAGEFPGQHADGDNKSFGVQILRYKTVVRGLCQ